MLREFREFAMRGNVVDMAVGIIIGAAFGRIVESMVKDLIMPPIGLLLGNVDFSDMFLVLKQGIAAGPYLTVEAAQKAGAVTFNYGMFVNNVVSFLVVAFAVFGVRTVLFFRQLGQVSTTEFEFPLWMLYALYPIGFALAANFCLESLLRELAGTRRPRMSSVSGE